jgi:hypothetical protein
MLEQAVYAGRNHAFSLAVALIALPATASAASAEDIARVGLGDAIGAVVVGGDGGARAATTAHGCATWRARPTARRG